MKRRITLSIALVLSVVLLSLMKSDWSANAAPPQRYSYDTGYLTPGANQFVRITIALGDGPEVGQLRIRRIQATQGSCSEGICSHGVASETTSPPLTLTPGGGFSADMDSDQSGMVRGIVLSDHKNLQLTVSVVDTETGKVVAIMTPADGCTAAQ